MTKKQGVRDEVFVGIWCPPHLRKALERLRQAWSLQRGKPPALAHVVVQLIQEGVDRHAND